MTEHAPQTRPAADAPRGRMTAVMRAISRASGARVLRVALVREGRIVDERVVARHGSVTIGPTERSTFVVDTRAIPPGFRLFEPTPSGVVLRWLDGMEGRVVHDGAVRDLAALAPRALRTRVGGRDVLELTLDDDARGKIVVGETALLFQRVAAAPTPSKPQLPTSVRDGTGLDWTTTIVAAFSFLLHFGLVGSIYSDWMDPLLDDDARTAQLVDSLRALPAPPPVETALEIVSEATPTSPHNAADVPKAARGTASSTKGERGSAAAGDAKAAALSKQLDSLNVEMLSALAATGSSTDRLLASSDMPTGMLDDAAAADRAVAPNGVAGLSMGRGGPGVVRPGAVGRGDLTAIGDVGRGDAPVSVGSAQAPHGPRGGQASIGSEGLVGGNVANATAVVARMQAGFRRCYNRELPNAPDMKGSVRITAKIGPNGEVAGASASGGGGLTPGLISCVTARVASAQFAAPDGGGATIVIPVTFFPQ